jgi:hypothetical protein
LECCSLWIRNMDHRKMLYKPLKFSAFSTKSCRPLHSEPFHSTSKYSHFVPTKWVTPILYLQTPACLSAPSHAFDDIMRRNCVFLIAFCMIHQPHVVLSLIRRLFILWISCSLCLISINSDFHVQIINVVVRTVTILCLIILYDHTQWRTEGGLGGSNPSPPKFWSFDKAEPNSQFRGKYTSNCFVFLFHHPN